MNNSLSFTEFVDSAGSQLLELLDNERINKLTDLPVSRIWKSTRMKERFILKQGKTPYDLAEDVTEKFLEQTGIERKNIGALALSHTHYDNEQLVHREIALRLAEKIGLNRERVASISFGCAGFPEIVSRAAKLAEQIDEDKHVLIITTETPDRMINATDPMATPIFAAGASATTLWRGEGHRLLFADAIETDDLENPSKTEIFTVHEENAPDFFGGESVRTIVRMDGDLAFVNGRALIEKAAFESLHRVMKNPSYHGSRVIVVPHQPNVRMLNLLSDFAAPEMQRGAFADYHIPEVTFVNGMEGMGNTISTTIPSTLSRIHSLINPPPQMGDIVLIPAAGVCVEHPGTKMQQGFGAIEW